ncbi:MAG: alpha/beta hydrolase [Gammaproteobacteria bacterium]|jgi:pimeloyl-ACP methyl ester carboxylesterase
MPFAEVNNVKLYYEDHGQGFPLVLISGFGADHVVWDAVLPFLKPHYRIIRFDNRGVGRSDAPDEFYNIKTMADDTAALMDYLQIEQAYICGHSMGTSISLNFALKYPQKVSKMILSNGFPKINALSKMVFDLLNRMIDYKCNLEILRDFFVPWGYANATLANLDNYPEVTARIEYGKTSKYPQTVIGFKRQLEALLSFSIDEELQKIAVPTLLIAGSNDILTPLEDTQYLAERIPDTQLWIADDTGHMTFVEKPQESSKIIDDFLLE